MRQRLLLLLFLFLLIVNPSWAKGPKPIKKDNQEVYQVKTSRTTTKINIDGLLNEAAWEEVEPANNFLNKWPTDSGNAEAITEVRLLYDETFLYVSAVCYIDEKPIISTLKRDAGHWNSDGFAVLFDPVNQKTNGFLFGVNAGGAQIEGLVSPEDASWNWDTKWYSEVKKYADKWVVEMAIPFKSLRYNAESTQWGINFVRNDMKRNVYSTWAHVPIPFRGIDLGYTGTLVWDSPIAKAKGNRVLIPYTTGGISKNHEDDESTDIDFNAGLDAKIAITSSLNLDITLNPNFSQVDADVQVANLSRFSIFFPERRSFFLENSDLFSRFGIFPVRPFFSRQIGIKDGELTPISGGLRLTGNINKDTRIGVMSMQSKAIEDFSAQNYSVAAVQRRVLKRSTIQGIFVNRQAYAKGEGFMKEDYNRVAGLEFNYLSEEGTWNFKARYHKSINPEDFDNESFISAGGEYRGRSLNFASYWNRIGENYIADIGFTPRLQNYDAQADTSVRLGYYSGWNLISYTFWPKNSKSINRHRLEWNPIIYLNADGSLNEFASQISYNINFKNRSNFRVFSNHNSVNLPFYTDLIGGDEYLPPTHYAYTNGGISYNSDQRKTVSWNARVSYGEFYNGTNFSYGGGFNIRRQPWLNVGANFSQNRVRLPENYGERDIWLISPKIEISFSNKMFWTTFLQFNTQSENFNINSRFQWRFKPMSDFFLVYTDNYATDNLEVKNRGIVFKINYWLNI